jgi:hypothetical protein
MSHIIWEQQSPQKCSWKNTTNSQGVMQANNIPINPQWKNNPNISYTDIRILEALGAIQKEIDQIKIMLKTEKATNE